ncbi:GNAT family N-acetyltransferase [Bacillus norwichensis]|uniref:N-acetyltransferase n=1 Tax=Bacillus norwichensis TaxID=2762217 RepID=A0ABR8VQ82_9BACI|nr:GNAT family N-acetyltransferase [Bacillus norwichensis]MBD8006924.1 N-acetyltransferase [Bacillus norwichensis]
MIEIKTGKNTFFVGENQEQALAEIHFVPTGAEKIIVDHTYVSDDLRGQGVGEALVEHIVAFARKEGKKIIPLCPFAKSQIDQHKEYQDVLADR